MNQDHVSSVTRYQYQVSFFAAIGRAFSQFCSFHGRASRSEYWWFYLFNLLVGCAIFAACGGTGYASYAWDMVTSCGRGTGEAVLLDGTFRTASNVWGIIVLLPCLGLFWRRMHDAGHSGWWWLWLLLPVVGWIIVLVALCKGSVPRTNKYGPVPNVRETHGAQEIAGV